jgi:hypothetical protein
MAQNQGVISPNDLMSRLVQAKKVMNKVDSGNFEKGYVNEEILRSDPENVVNLVQGHQPTPPAVNRGNVVNVDKINNSKLPDVIKKAMIENPIPQITLNDSINMDFIQGAKKLMEREGLSKKTQPKQQQMVVQQPYSNVDMNSLTTLIENTIRKVLDEKLNQILTAQQTATINENLVLKVGDSIFKGKITGVNKAK